MKSFFRNVLPFFTITVTAALLSTGCDVFKNEDTSGTISLQGQVLNEETNNPVEGAVIRVSPYEQFYETDQNGFFVQELKIDSTTTLTVEASRTGYISRSYEVLAIAGRTVDVPVFRLVQFAEEVQESGFAANILLQEQSSESIGVIESGSQEVAEISFLVADSSGRPVVLDKSTSVRFSFGSAPGGGEYLFPTEATTDNNGIAVVHLSSGTKAGVVQVVAELTSNGTIVRSRPVVVAIHGGLPDQEHFSIGPGQFNFPGLLTYGLKNPISVIVGDKFSNPVRIGTSVYFSSTHGVVLGSIQTDDSGQGEVDLISANPLPVDGIALVTATSADENELPVVGSTPVVFSGAPFVSVSPSVALLDQTYELTVRDQNGNPLAPGTQISVKVEGESVKAVGNTAVTLDDTVFSGGVLFEHVVRGYGITQFTFRAVSDIAIGSTTLPSVEAITVLISGPNGSIEIVLTPASAPNSPTEGITLRMSDGNTIEAFLEPVFEE
jgi:hypothetical protein